MSLFTSYFSVLEKAHPGHKESLKHLENITQDYFSCVEHFNFTGHKTPETFFYKNILDSIAPFLHYPLPSGKAIDIGTGGGFPGVPLAVLAPQLDWVLTDSVQKKLTLIERISKDHHLPNIRTAQARLEELAHKKNFREQFDVVTAKALAHISPLLEYALPFLRLQGKAYLYLSHEQIDELKTKEHIIELLGGKLEMILSYTLEHEGTRYIAVIEKISPTKATYPRKIGTPKNTPLQ